MLLLAVPNIAEGRDPHLIAAFCAAAGASARILDVHSDQVHNRTVLTLAGGVRGLVGAAVALARESVAIDMNAYDGLHPALGGLDVFPVVPYEGDISAAAECAGRAGHAIAAETGAPVIFYGAAARRPENRHLPDIRKGGMAAIRARIAAGTAPDEGPRERFDAARGITCVGARDALIAFNVVLRCDAASAGAIARAVRESSGGLPGVRAMAVPVAGGLTQVSMNLVAPDRSGIDEAFDAVEGIAQSYEIEPVATEIVGLVHERHLPHPEKRAARLLVAPGRSFEAMLKT